MPTKIASFVLNSEQKNNALSDIYIAQPDAVQEDLAGRLFIIMDVDGKRSDALKITDFLINYISTSYYQDEKIMLKEKIGALRVENIFEAVLAKANKEFTEFLNQEKIRIMPQSISLMIGLIYKNELHFSAAGRNKAFLIHKQGSEHRLIDINENSREETAKKPDHLKAQENDMIHLFSTIINGEMPPESFFVFCNEALPEYLSNKELISIVTKLPPLGAVEQIKNTLQEINTYVPFLGIVIKNTLWAEEPEPKREFENSAQASLSNLNSTEAKTEKILTPAGLMSLKKMGKKIGSNLEKINLPAQKRKEIGTAIKDKGFFLKDKIFVKRKSSPLSLTKIKKTFKNISLANLGNSFNRQIKSLSGKNRTTAIILLVCVVLLGGGLVNKNIKNKREARHQEFLELTQKIEQKQNQISSYLLYKNEAGAKSIIAELREVLNNFPQDTKEEIEYLQGAQSSFAEQVAKIQRMIAVDSPVEVANWNGLKENPQAEYALLLNNQIYSIDNPSQKVYKLNLGDKSQSIIDFPTSIQNLSKGVTNEKHIYFLSGNQVAQLDTETDKISGLEIDLSDKENDVSALGSYNNNLYVLDKNEGQIYKYSKSGSSFGSREAWIKDENTIKNAVSMAIDGNIYALEEGGAIKKYLKGEERDFNLEIIDPSLANADKMYASFDFEYIYILDKSQQRLVVFDKEGKFQWQYKLNQNITDFTIDEANKIVYFLADNIVYSFDINQ